MADMGRHMKKFFSQPRAERARVKWVVLIAIMAFAGCAQPADFQADQPQERDHTGEEFPPWNEGPQLTMVSGSYHLPVISFENATANMTYAATLQLTKWFNVAVADGYFGVNFTEEIEELYWNPLQEAWATANMTARHIGVWYENGPIFCDVGSTIT